MQPFCRRPNAESAATPADDELESGLRLPPHPTPVLYSPPPPPPPPSSLSHPTPHPLFIINPSHPFPPSLSSSSPSSSMENHCIFNSGAEMRLPPGFRFHPTDEELVLQYLRRKVLSFPLPASIIPDLHFSYSNPWHIPGESGEERYFFSKKGGSRSNRATYEGYWKSTGVDRQVLSSVGKLVGFKKTLVFYRGKSLPGSRTDWFMHEYRLASDMVEAGAEDWVLCRVFLKKKKNTKRRREAEEAVRWQSRGNSSNGTIVAGVVAYDLLKNNKCVFSCSCSSSCSSVITELNLKGLDDDDTEESSCCSTSIFRREL